jgi:hypothetical protein
LDQYFLEPSNIINRTQRPALSVGCGVSPEIEDRVPDELSGAVEGYVAAAVALEDFHSTQSQLIRRQQNVGCFRIPSQRDNGCVLKQKQNVANAISFAEFNQFLLDAQSGRVVDLAEL